MHPIVPLDSGSIIQAAYRALLADPRYDPASSDCSSGPQDGAMDFPEIKTADDIIANTGRIPPMLIDGLLPDHSLFLLTGKPKAGKSFLALDIAASVTRSQPLFGTLTVNRPGPVLYLALEDGDTELARRLQQRGHQPITNHQQPATSNLYFITEPFCLTEPL